ncbi:jg7994 [Pararge aegeria aegeria]|uniref:Jg7994 protein n=1 Tax=Pararge aegeria aegeria TaxID=348720 RepID=A0A8S4RH10_9NEOP|nr:jg7994 [Pararge aegeria aegeria]
METMQQIPYSKKLYKRNMETSKDKISRRKMNELSIIQSLKIATLNKTNSKQVPLWFAVLTLADKLKRNRNTMGVRRRCGKNIARQPGGGECFANGNP